MASTQELLEALPQSGTAISKSWALRPNLQTQTIWASGPVSPMPCNLLGSSVFLPRKSPIACRALCSATKQQKKLATSLLLRLGHFVNGFVLRQASNSDIYTEETAISSSDGQKYVYSVWAVPPDEVVLRAKKLMEGLREEFGGPQFEPHITVVGATSLTADDAVAKFRSACQGLKAYNVTVDRVATGTFFYQCVYLLIHPTAEVVEASSHCTGHFGYKSSTSYMPHLSLLYQDLTEEEKKKAQEKANALDGSINGLSFPITRLALYKTDTEDKTLKSWEKIAECSLETE